MKHRILKLTLSALLFCTAAVNAKEETPFIEYHNRMTVLGLGNVGSYERIKPNSIYWGLEGWGARDLLDTHELLAEIEFRMGYNFFYNGRDHFTPLAGIGYVQDFEIEHHRSSTVINGYVVESVDIERRVPGILYGTVGFLYDHEFNSVFNLGLNVKGLIGGPVDNVDHPLFDWGSPVVGCDVSLPVTFRFGHKRHWDYRIEPFDLYLRGTNAARNYFGLRGALAYRF